MHSDVSEELFAGILQAGTKQIDHIVDNQEAIVIVLTYIYYNRWILLVMTLDVELQLLGELACVDGGRYIWISFAEHGESSLVDVVLVLPFSAQYQTYVD